MDDGQRSLARMLHPKAGPRQLLVVIKHTDWKARYLRVYMLREFESCGHPVVGWKKETVHDITESVADALRLEMFDPDMNLTDDYGYVLQHSASIMLRIHLDDAVPGRESPGSHIGRTLERELNELAGCTCETGSLQIKVI